MRNPAQNSAENHLSMSDDVGEAVPAVPLNLDNCPREDIYAMVEQIVDPGNHLRDINEAHCQALKKSFRSYKYNYVVA